MFMKPTRKQEIYLQIAGFILPYLRSLHSHPTVDLSKHGRFFAELELVHNLPERLISPDFTKSDAYWVTTQGWIYIKQGRRDMPFYEEICELLREFNSFVPE